MKSAMTRACMRQDAASIAPVVLEFVQEPDARAAEQKLSQALQVWRDELIPQTEDLFYHYTSTKCAKLIAASGLKVSKVGMGGTGIYVATKGPTHPSFSPCWPIEEWKQSMLRENYGDKACNDPNRQGLIDAVVVMRIPSKMLRNVPERPGALVLSDEYFPDNNGFIGKEMIIAVVPLYEPLTPPKLDSFPEYWVHSVKSLQHSLVDSLHKQFHPTGAVTQGTPWALACFSAVGGGTKFAWRVHGLPQLRMPHVL